jgi:membrane protein implicated in regulation of membrane protease activity
MVTCPWCGTTYVAFQSNCTNCGGLLQPGDEKIASSVPEEALPTPPATPRPIPQSYVWRLLSRDGWLIPAFVFGVLGLVFSLVGAGLTIAIITAFLGIPFLALGVAFLVAAAGMFLWRYQKAQKIVNVLREGEATRGKIIELQENYSVVVNGRHPWVIRYQFQANGQDQEGKVTVLNPPGDQLQTGKAICVLYLPAAPEWSSIYPHP